MLYSTHGIVIHSLKYSETSLIVKIFTEQFGIRAYLLKGLYGKRSKIKPALFQPMTLLDLVVYHREKHSLQTVKEARLAFPYMAIPSDMRKSALLIFINELVYRAIREEEANPELFAFLWQSCRELDETDTGLKDLPVRFAIRLSRYLGIFPHNNYSETNHIFNLREGVFQPVSPDHPQYLDPVTSRNLSCLLNDAAFPVPRTSPGHLLLESILTYYRIHLPGFRDLQSHHILHEVLA
jgi:DNA repair protein RecO (recombination protein O)